MGLAGCAELYELHQQASNYKPLAFEAPEDIKPSLDSRNLRPDERPTKALRSDTQKEDSIRWLIDAKAIQQLKQRKDPPKPQTSKKRMRLKPIILTKQEKTQRNIANFREVRAAIADILPGLEEGLIELYARRENRPLWYGSQGWSPQAWQALELSLNGPLYGLPSRRYWTTPNYRLPDHQEAGLIAQADIMLSRVLLLQTAELKAGFGASMKTSVDLLDVAQQKGAIGRLFLNQEDKGRQYQGLKSALANLELSGAERLKVMLNMNRLRSSGEQLDAKRRIRVNMPSFHLDVFEGAALVRSMKVIIGQEDRQTPVLHDKIVNLKFSPDWTVPRTAAREDFLPLLQSIPEKVIGEFDLEVYQGGKSLDPYKVDWATVDPNRIPYVLRQKPGPKNALGGVRFSMTNKQSIYLHDTPDKELFNLSLRMISSGCVRVSDAPWLAQWMMQDNQQAWNHKQVRAAMQKGIIEYQKLKEPVFVDIVYYTAMVDAKGRLRFYDDIYHHDAKLVAKFNLEK